MASWNTPVELLVLGVGEAAEDAQLGAQGVGRIDQRALGEVGSDLGELLAGPLDRREIGRSGDDLRRVSRVVAPVEPGVGGALPVRGLRNQHVVGVEHRAFLGREPDEVGIVGGEALDVARPGDRHRDVAGGEVSGVVVAGEGADLAALARLLDLRAGGGGICEGRLRGIGAETEHDQAESVAHLGQHGDLALEFGIEEIFDAGELASGLLRVVADADHARHPRHAVLPARIEAHVAQRVEEVGLVGEAGVVERRAIAERDHPGDHPVGEDHDVAVDRLVALQRLVDLGEELVVVVDVLAVLDGDPGRCREIRNGLLVDVERPVGDPQRALWGAVAAAVEGAAAGASAAFLPQAASRPPPKARPPAAQAERPRNCRRLCASCKNRWNIVSCSRFLSCSLIVLSLVVGITGRRISLCRGLPASEAAWKFPAGVFRRRSPS